MATIVSVFERSCLGKGKHRCTGDAHRGLHEVPSIDVEV